MLKRGSPFHRADGHEQEQQVPAEHDHQDDREDREGKVVSESVYEKPHLTSHLTMMPIMAR
jgi:hypothetical protein